MASGIGSHTKPNKGVSDNWLTPPWIIEALGGSDSFDLDPCAHSDLEGYCWATAMTFYSQQADGLSKKWHGRVWLNPPYSQVGLWLHKLACHGKGTALIFARTETSWFVSEVWQRATACVFIFGRLHFHHPDGRRAKHNSGGPSVLVAYGDDDARILREKTEQHRIPGKFVDLRD